MDGEELILRFAAVDGLSHVIDSMGRKVEEFGSAISGMGGKVGAAVGGMVGDFGKVIAGIGGVVGVGVGLFATLDHLATQTAEYALHVEQLSNRLNINTDLVQTMYQSFKMLGDSTDAVDLMMTRLSKNLEAGGTTLKAYGLTLKDLGVTSTNLNVALPQLADYFHNTDNAQQKAAISMALFGRNAQNVTAFLNMGSAGINRLTEEFRGLGLILDGNTLKVDATAKLMQDKLHLVLQGLEMTIGNALIPAFMMLWSVLGKVLDPMGKAGGMANALGRAFAQAVVWIAAFISAVTGVSINLKDIVGEGQSAIGTLAMMGGTAADAGAGMQGAAGGTRALTTALNDQMQAIQDQQTAYDESMQAQIDALHAQDVAYNQVIDTQIRQLDLQRQAIQLAQQEQAMKDTLLTDKQAISKAETDLARAPYLGITDLSSLQSALLNAQKKLTQDTTKQATDAKLHELDVAKVTLEQQKLHYDEASAQQIRGIEAVKKSHDDAFKDQIKNIQAELKEITEKDAKALSSGLSTDATLGGSAATTAAGMQKGFSLTGDEIIKMGSKGTGAANDMKSAFQGLIDTLNTLKSTIDTIKTLWGDFTGSTKSGSDWWSTDHITPWLDSHVNVGPNVNWGNIWSTLTGGGSGGTSGVGVASYDVGGTVSGAAGAPQLAIVHGGEQVSTQADMASVVSLLSAILSALNQPGNPTGMQAAMTRMLSNNDYARSRGVVSHSPA